MYSPIKGLSVSIWHLCRLSLISAIQTLIARLSYFVTEWVLSTNHRRIAVLYFFFVLLAGFTGLILATIIRLELAYPGQFFLTNNAERYLTTISLHGVVMVFFMIIPVLFGAFGNFLLPTQLGIRDVAFPRLNSFMFWVTPSGFVLLLHILLFDRSYNLTYWLNYGEVKAALRRRYSSPASPDSTALFPHLSTELGWRLHNTGSRLGSTHDLSVTANPTIDSLSAYVFASFPFNSSQLSSVRAQHLQEAIHSCHTFAGNPSTRVNGPLGLESGSSSVLRPITPSLKSIAAQLVDPSIEVTINYSWGGGSRATELDSSTAPLHVGASKAANQLLHPSSSAPLLANADLAMD
jgi:hypothetical protein